MVPGAGDEDGAAAPLSPARIPVPTVIALDETLSDGAFRLWVVLFQLSLTGAGEAFEATVPSLAELTSASHVSVTKRVKELVAADYLEVASARGLGRANMYTVKMPGEDVRQPVESGPAQ